MGAHTEGMGLPPKRLGALSMLSVPGISKMSEQDLIERLRVSDTFLPKWPEVGIRNRMAASGYCAGFVDPENPINPLADDEITEEIRKNSEAGDGVKLLGSYLWLKVVEITPVVSKAELEAFSHKLICKAMGNHTGEDENRMPVAVPSQTLIECRSIANERLIKKAGVKVAFYDVVLDPANELFLCNTSSPVTLRRIMDRLAYVLAGRFSGDGIGVEADHAAQMDEYAIAEVMQGGMDAGVFKEETEKNGLEKLLCKIAGTDDIWKYIGMGKIQWPTNMLQLFNMAAPGIIATQAFSEELETVLADAETMLKSKNKSEDLVLLGRLYEVYEKIEEKFNALEMIPSLRSINVQEAKGAGMKYPLGDDSYGVLHKSSRVTIFNAVMNHVRFDTYAKFESSDSILSSTLSIKSIEGDMILGPHNITVKFSGKGQSIVKVVPGNPDSAIIPLKAGLSMPDIVDRIETSIDICRKLNTAFKDVYRYAALIYVVASGIKLIVDQNSSKG